MPSPNRPNISAQLPQPALRRLDQVPLARELCATGAGYHLRMGESPWLQPPQEPEWRLLPDALFHFYPQSGRWVETEAGRQIMPANSLMCMPPEFPFRHGLGERKRVNTTYWFRMQGAALPFFFQLIQWSPSRPFVQVEETVPFLELCQSLLKILLVPATQATLFRLASVSARLLGRVAEAAKQAEYHLQPANQRVHEVIKFLRDNPTASLSLQDLAGMANLSTQHFRGLFKQLTGYAPSQYHAQIKAQHAARLLCHTDDPVSLIAMQVGFEDPLYFSRWFRRIMGRPPRDYAREHRVRG